MEPEFGDTPTSLVIPADTRETGEPEITGNPELEEIELEATVPSPSITSSPAPVDRYKGVYLIMVLHGVGTLMPWNMFINAKAYFEGYKLGQPDARWYATKFFGFLLGSSQLPNLVFGWVNILCPCKGSLRTRILATLPIELLVCVATMILAPIDTSGSPALFFWLTIFSVGLMNTAGGLYQNSVYGIASQLGYSDAVVLGSNLCGVFVSVANLLVHGSTPSPIIAAMAYFATFTVIMLLCLLSYLLLLPKCPYFRHHVAINPTAIENENAPPRKCVSRVCECFRVWKQCWSHCVNVFLVYFVTLAVFPNVTANVRPTASDFFIPDKYFTDVTCFLTFNVAAFLGNLLATKYQWIPSRYLWIPVVSRILFIPFFLVCNYHPLGYTRGTSSVIFEDWTYWLLGVMLLGATCGYLGSLAMTYCPRIVENQEDASLAGMLGAGFLVLGVICGVLCSLLMPYLVETPVRQ